VSAGRREGDWSCHAIRWQTPFLYAGIYLVGEQPPRSPSDTNEKTSVAVLGYFSSMLAKMASGITEEGQHSLSLFCKARSEMTRIFWRAAPNRLECYLVDRNYIGIEEGQH
jgi:hypothetical protein